MVDLLCEWKTTLRGERRFKQQQRLLQGQNDPTIQEATALLSCNKLWVDVEDFLVMARIGGLENAQFRLLTAALLALLLQRSWQRLGAVVLATLAEFQSCTEVETEGGETVYVMRVLRHKTARQGPANITMTKADWRLLRRYIKYARPMMDPAGQIDNLLVSEGPKPIQQVNRELQLLAATYEVAVPSATTLRKVAATASLKTHSHGESQLIARQMSHGPAVHALHYQRVMGVEETAAAHQLRRQLVQKGNGEEDQRSKDDSEKASNDRKKAKRFVYTERETSLIETHFEKDIQEGKTPGLKDCAKFLTISGIHRSAKLVQDRVRTLGKKLRAEKADSSSYTNYKS